MSKLKTFLEPFNKHYGLWTAVAFTIICGAIMQIKGGMYVSPFIETPQATIPSLNNWAKTCFSPSEQRWFFYTDILFALGLFAIHNILFHLFRNFKQLNLNWVTVVFLAAVLLDWGEGLCFFFAFKYAPLVQNLKVLAYLISWVILLFLGIQTLIDWINTNKGVFRFFFQKYFSYFYSSLISMLVLFLVFTNFNQFDALMIELTQPINLIIFFFLYLGTIVKVWFIPYYLQFTDGFYDNLKQGEFKQAKIANPDTYNKRVWVDEASFPDVASYKGIFIPIRKLLKKVIKKEISKNETKKRIVSTKNTSLRAYFKNLLYKQKEEFYYTTKIQETIKYPWRSDKDDRTAYNYFHITRRVLGICFILVLFFLQYSTFSEVEKNLPVSPTIATIILAIILFTTQRKAASKINKTYLNRKSKNKAIIAINNKIRDEIFYKFIGFFVLFLIGIVSTGLCYYYNHHRLTLFLFIITTLLAAFAFIYFAVIRYNYEKKESPDDVTYPEILYEKINAFLMVLSIQIIPIIFVAFFFFSLFGDISILKGINPINYYLLYVNGIIGVIAILDRGFKIFFKRPIFKLEGYNVKLSYLSEIRTKATFKMNSMFIAGLVTLILVLVFLRFQEDFHHEVVYIDKDKVEEKALTLETYTENLLNRTAQQQDSTLYLIAAEGGGLRAAYWTMLVLNQGETDSTHLFSNAFVMSGASGGAIGQGMFNYIKAKKLDKSIIHKIGDENFFTTDLSGLLTRAMFSSVLPFEFTKKWGDRHYYMAKGYFDLIHPNAWHNFKNEPFHKLWTDASYELPLIIVNTTRTEDGQRAIVHPLSTKVPLLPPFQDLTINNDSNYIAYPQAVFLTNRFPLASPAARIESEGHFVDGGYLENSGLQTILQLLLQMKSEAPTNPTYQRFFARKIKLVNIQNSRDGFVANQLEKRNITQNNINRILQKGEITSIISAAAGGGLTALPLYYNRLFQNKSVQTYLGLNKYTNITLPHYIPPNLPHKIYYGQLETAECALNDTINAINAQIKATHSIKVLMPPLGRMMTKSTTEYMREMLWHPEVRDSIQAVLHKQ